MQLQYEEDRLQRTHEEVVKRLPFVRPFPFTDTWTDEQYTELMAEWNIYAPHEVPHQRIDPAEAAVIDLQRELIRNVGDDVVKGIVYARDGGDGALRGTDRTTTEASVQERDEPESPESAAGQDDDAQRRAKKSFGSGFRIAGRTFTLPLSKADVEALTAMTDSLRAQRGQANVGYPNKFKGVDGRTIPDCDLYIPMTADEKESETKGVVLGDLASFNFPTAIDGVLRAICPDADDITIVPHRLEVYRQGDSLAKHTEPREKPKVGKSPTGDEGDEVGHIIVHLPSASEYRDGLKRKHRKDMLNVFDPDRTPGTYESGEQRFYVGRSLASSNAEIDLETIHNMKDVGFDRPNAQAVLETRVALAEYTATEVTINDGSRPMNYAAYASDVYYEALPVLNKTMVTLKFKIFKGKRRLVWHVPRRDSVLQKIQRAFHMMALRPNPVTLLPGFPHDPAFLRPVHLGLILRHTYEPADVLRAMEDPTKLLRGLDAITYRIVSGAFESRLLPAVVYKSDCHCAAWRVQEFPHRFVFASLKGYNELRNDLGDHRMSDEDTLPLLVSALENTIVNCLWAQIGNGRLLGGGGNAYDTCVCDTIPDCGTDWWYQNAVLVVTPEPARWARRKALFSIRDRSRDRTATAQSGTHSLAGALAHWNILESVATYL